MKHEKGLNVRGNPLTAHTQLSNCFEYHVAHVWQKIQRRLNRQPFNLPQDLEVARRLSGHIKNLAIEKQKRQPN